MTMIYSNPAREKDGSGALPDVEVWQHHHPLKIGGRGTRFCEPTVAVFDAQGVCRGAGWYWQPTEPDVMADGGPGAVGPFDTEAEAVADAQVGNDDDDMPDDDEPELPPCVLAMRCYCAGHARGNPASEPCDTSETEPECGEPMFDGAARCTKPKSHVRSANHLTRIHGVVVPPCEADAEVKP